MSAPHRGIHPVSYGAGTILRLDDPARPINLLSRDLMQALDRWLSELFAVSPAPAWLLIEGNGRGSFAAGADLAEIGRLDGFSAEHLSRLGQRVVQRLWRAPCPTAALVAGHARGGGLDLAMSCDLLGATPAASLGHPGLARGFFSGWAGTQQLPRAAKGCRGVGALLQAEILQATAACRSGWVTHVAPETELRDWLMAGLGQLTAWPRPALEVWRVSLRRAVDPRLARRLLELARVDTV